MEYVSPFRSSTFQASNDKTVRQEYVDRITQIYYTQFPTLATEEVEQRKRKLTDDEEKKDEKAEDKDKDKDKDNEKDNDKEKEKDNKDENKDKDKKEEVAKKEEDNKPKNDNADNDKANKDDKVDADANKKDNEPKNDENDKNENKDQNADKDKEKENEPKNENKDKEADEKKDEKNNNDDGKAKDEVDEKAKEREEAENNLSVPRKKLNRALKLLDEEYFGREQEFYELLFNKYDMQSHKSIELKPEYLPSKYYAPLISELLITERGEAIECSECLQEFHYSEFPEDEFNNGYYLACYRCAPDRNNVIALKWHAQFKSASVVLENNNYIAKVTQSTHRYALAHARPALKGVHCWRWYTKHYQSWFLWGISNCKKYTDNSYGNQAVYGIAGANQSYKNGQCCYDVQTNHFFGGKTEVFIDMLLDLNKGELRFKIPGNASESKMVGIPKNNALGWVPHCNIHYANASVQIKRIPVTWYGKMPKRVKFT